MDIDEARAVLGVGEGTDLAGLRAAYRALVRDAHPDVAPAGTDAHTRTARLTQAYEVAVAHVADPPRPPVADPPADPPAPARPAPAAPDRTHGDDEGVIVVDAPPPSAWAALVDAAGRVGEITYVDARLGILEIVVRFAGGPSCSLLMTVHGHGDHTEVRCALESIESAPAPGIAGVIGALTSELQGR